jgi:hypothetical protein
MTAGVLAPDFRYWNAVDPSLFLQHDWENPSRVWAAGKAIAAASGGTLWEIGPGQGLDYERHFRRHVVAHGLTYVGVEGATTLHAALCERFPESAWLNATIADLRPQTADVVYVRHVMEHQPALEPALGQLLGAARLAIVLTWYRPPSAQPISDTWKGVPCHTYEQGAVRERITAAGFRVTEIRSFVGTQDETWVLER